MLSAGIGFIVDLPRDEAVALLKKWIAGLEQRRSAVTEYYTPEDGLEQRRSAVTEYYTPEDGLEQLGHIGEIMNLWVHSADGGVEWARGLIERIEGGSYTFAGEGEPFVGVLADDEPNPFATGPAPSGQPLATHLGGGAGVGFPPASGR